MGTSSKINFGKIFENNFRDSIPDNAYYLRINDNISVSSQVNNVTRFTLSNPYDCLVYADNLLYTLELKTIRRPSLSFETEEDKGKRGRNIRWHQIQGLKKAGNYGIISGFIVNFRMYKDQISIGESTFFLPIDNFLYYCNKYPQKRSINFDHVCKLGIDIKARKKIKYYKYDLTDFFNKINLIESIINTMDVQFNNRIASSWHHIKNIVNGEFENDFEDMGEDYEKELKDQLKEFLSSKDYDESNSKFYNIRNFILRNIK